jgi:hypothetical protein
MVHLNAEIKSFYVFLVVNGIHLIWVFVQVRVVNDKELGILVLMQAVVAFALRNVLIQVFDGVFPPF